MIMGRFCFCLCVLLLIAVSEAKKPNRRLQYLKLKNPIPVPEICGKVQNFDPGFKYTFRYEATVESHNNQSVNASIGKQIKCHHITIRVPSRCFGVLEIQNCTEYESYLNPNGTLNFSQHARPSRLSKKLELNRLYFHFNEGEINKLFYFFNEHPDVINMKRGVLSALQFKFNQGDISRKPVGTVVSIPEVNVFGKGNSTAEVQSIEQNRARKIKLSRDLDQFEIPWARSQWAYLRSILDDTSVGDLASDLFVEQARNITANASQTCEYILEKGRYVVNVSCAEVRPVNFFNNSIFHLIVGSNNLMNFTSNSTVNLTMERIGKSRLGPKDNMSPAERNHFQKYYKDESLMFEDQWEETFDGIYQYFTPVEVMVRLVSNQANRTTPALLSKLARYICRSEYAEIRRIWYKVQRKIEHNYHHLMKATNIWIQILNGCNGASYWCSLPDCKPNPGCQDALKDFIDSSSFLNLTNSIKDGIIEAISSLKEPNISMVVAANNICKLNQTSKTVLMLGRVVNHYLQKEDAVKHDQRLINAKKYLLEVLHGDCGTPERSSYHDKEVKIAALNSLGAMMEEGVFARETILRCVSYSKAPREVLTHAARALKQIPLTKMDKDKVVAIYQNDSLPTTVRLASYLVVITKEPTEQQVRSILHTAANSSEPEALKYFVKRHITSQVLLQNTSFCELSNRTIRVLIDVINRNVSKINIKVNETLSEKTFAVNKTMTIPYINAELNCTVVGKFVFTKLSLVPVLANITVYTEFEESNITLLESVIDINKLFLDTQVGEHSLIPKQSLNSFFNLPLATLLKPIMRDVPLLTHEELERLSSIQDEGSLTYMMMLMKSKSPLSVKVLGQEINSNTIFSFPVLKYFKLKNVWELVNILERGWRFEGVLTDQPLLAHSASPSSVGAPHILRLEASYFMHLHSYVKIPVRKLFLTRQGKIEATSNSIVESVFVMDQKVQFPGNYSSGTGQQISVGHKSNLTASVEVQQNALTFEVQQLDPEIDLVNVRMDDVVVNDSDVILLQYQQETQCQPCSQKQCKPCLLECPMICIWPVEDCPEVAMLYKDCLRPKLDLGLYLRNNITNRLQIAMNWSSTITKERNTVSNISMGVKTGESLLNDVGKFHASYCAEENRLSIEILNETHIWKRIEAQSRLLMTKESNQTLLLDQFIASLNVTVFPENNVTVNQLTILKKPESTFAEISDFFGFVQYQDPSKADYVIKSELHVLGVDLSSEGELSINTTTGNYSLTSTTKAGSWGHGHDVLRVVISSQKEFNQSAEDIRTEIKVKNIYSSTSKGRNPFAYLNKFSEFHCILNSSNDTLGNVVHDSVFEVYLRKSKEPYFLISSANCTKLGNETYEPYVCNATYTVNKAQLQLNTSSFSVNQTAMSQFLVLPSSSIPFEFMKDQHQRRIKENSKIFLPTVYAGLQVINSSQPNYFQYVYDIQRLQMNDAGVMMTRNFCSIFMNVKPKSFDISMDFDGIGFTLSHGDNEEWQGHSLLVNMHQSYLKYIPVSNQTKDVVMRYTKCFSSNSLKFGYIFKTNFSSNSFFTEIGYYLGDKKLDVITNVSLPRFQDAEQNITVRFNSSCDQCLIVSDLSFQIGFGLRINESRPHLFKKFAVDFAQSYDIAFGLQVSNGVEFQTGLHYDLVKDKELIVDLKEKANVSFILNRSYLAQFFQQPYYFYTTAFNLSLVEKANRMRQTIYSVSYPIGFKLDSPLMQGTWMYGPVVSDHTICLPGKRCTKHIVHLTQVEKCKDYSAFYANRQEKAKFASVNCTVQNMTYLVTEDGETWNFTFEHDGQRNPDLTLKYLRLNSICDVDSNMVNNVSINMSRHIWPSPILISVNSTVNHNVSDYAMSLNSSEINGYLRKPSDQDVLSANITTHHIPIQINCSLIANFEQAVTSYNVTNCSISYPSLSNSTTLEVRANGTYENFECNSLKSNVINRTSSSNLVSMDMDLVNGLRRLEVYCGNKSNPNSSCEFILRVSDNVMNLYARANSSLLNHTTEANITGLSSGCVMDLMVDVNTSSTVQFKRENNVSTYHKYGQVDRLTLDAGVKENCINLFRFNASSANLYVPQDVSSVYLHYITNRTTDLDLHFKGSLRQELKTEFRLYRGLNRPHSPMHLKSNLTHGYLQSYFLKYARCQENMTASVKNLYDYSNVKNRSLVKMEAIARSNIWPESCDNKLHKILREIFPQSSYISICAGDRKVMIDYDLYNNTATKVELYKEEVPLFTAEYHLEENVHKLKARCENATNSTCEFSLLMGSHHLSVNSSLISESVRHRSNLSLTTSPSSRQGKPPAVQLKFCTNNTFGNVSHPIRFDTVVKFSENESLFVSSKLNISKRMENSILIENGTIKHLKLQGKSVVIFSKPRDWNVTFIGNGSDYEIFADVKVDLQTRLTAIYYEGRNEKNSSIYQRFAPIDKYIEGFAFNYSTCGEHGFVNWSTVLDKKHGDHLITESIIDIDMYPFKRPSTYMLPVSLSCPLCLGEFEMVAIVNSTENNQLVIDALLGKSSLFSVNCTFGQNNETSEYFFISKAEVIYNIQEVSSPRMLAASNVSILPGEHVIINHTLLREGFETKNFLVKEHYMQGPGKAFKLHLNVEMEIISLLFNIGSGNETIKFYLMSPYYPGQLISFTLEHSEDVFVLKNTTLKALESEFHLVNVNFTVLRNKTRYFNGIKMHDLDLRIISNPYYQHPDVVYVSGSGQAIKGQKWYVHIYDIEERKFVVSSNWTEPFPSDHLFKSFVQIRLPVLEVDLNGTSTYKKEQLRNQYRGAVSSLHFTSGHLVPVFQLRIDDNLRKKHDCVYHGVVSWEANLWSASDSFFYANPTLKIDIGPNPILKQPIQNIMKLNFTMGKSLIFSELIFTNEMQQMIELFSIGHTNLSMCVPKTAKVGTTLQLPYWELYSNGMIDPNKYVFNTNTTMYFNMPVIHTKEKIVNVTNVADFAMIQNVLVGKSITNGTMLLPVHTPFIQEFNITAVNLSTGATARKMSFLHKSGNSEPMIFNVSEPLLENRRDVHMKAFGRNVLTSKLNFSECALPLLILPEILCIPSSLKLENLNADIPLPLVLQQLPIAGLLIPDIQLLDIKLVNSSVSLNATKHQQNWTISSNASLNSPTFMEMISLLEPTILKESMERFNYSKYNHWNISTYIAHSPNGTEFMYDDKSTSPLIDERLRLYLNSSFIPSELIYQLKTKEILEDLLPIDVDMEYIYYPSNNTWNFEVHKFDFKVFEQVMANISLKTDQNLLNSFTYKWSMKSFKFPVLNHGLNITVNNTVKGQPLNISASFQNSYFEFNSQTENKVYIYNLTIRFPDKVKRANVTYVLGNANSSKLIVKTDSMLYLCNSSMTRSHVVHTNCTEMLLNSSGEVTSVAVKKNVGRVPISIRPSTALVLAKEIGYNYLTSQEGVEGIVQSVLGIQDDKLKQNISDFIVNIVNKYKNDLQNLSQFSSAKSWQDWIATIIDVMPDFLPVSEQMKQAIANFDQFALLQNAIKMRVVNGTGFLALQYNVTGTEPSNTMLQINFTMFQGWPVANLSLFTPYSEMYILFNVGPPLIYAPQNAGVKSLTTTTMLSVDFNCNGTGSGCLIADLRMPTGRQYLCFANAPEESEDYNVVCYEIDKYALFKEVATFTTNMTSFYKTLETIYSLTVSYIDDQLETYIDHLMNISAASNFSHDVTQTISNSYETLRKISISVFSKNIERFNQLKQLAEEAATFAVYLTKEQTNQTNSTSINIAQSIANYFSVIPIPVAIRIPLFEFKIMSLMADLHVELGNPERYISLVLNTTLTGKTNFSEEFRVMLFYINDSPMVRVSVNNSALYLFMDFSFKNKTLVKGKIGFPEDENTFDIYYIGQPGAAMKEYVVNFVDTEGAYYQCNARDISPEIMRTNCSFKMIGSTSPIPLCQFDMQSRYLNVMEVISQVAMSIPQMYMVVNQPEMFKQELGELFNVTTQIANHSLDVIAEFLIKKSNATLNRLHEDFIQYYSDKVTAIPALINQNWTKDVLGGVLANVRLMEANRGEKTLEQAMKETIDDVAPSALAKLEQSIQIAQQTSEDVNKIVKHLSELVIPVIRNFTSTPFISNRVKETRLYIKNLKEVGYAVVLATFVPHDIKSISSRLYSSLYFSDYIENLLKLGGPVCEWLTDTIFSEIISYNHKSYLLPIPQDESNCTYLYVTEPLRNQFNILSRGRSLILALPNKTVELDPRKRVYVKNVNDTFSREVILPYYSDDVSCEVLTNTTVVCETMDYKILMRTQGNQTVQRIVTIYDPQFSIGVMGLQSDVPSSMTSILPNGTEPLSSSELSNAYLLDNFSQCIYQFPVKIETFTDSEGSCDGICERLFNSSELAIAHLMLPDLFQSYKNRCERTCRNNDTSMACKVVQQFRAACAQRGVEVDPVKECLVCNLVEMKQIVLERAEVYLLVSMSSDVIEADPKKLIRKLSKALFTRMQYDRNLNFTKVGIVTYGGEGAELFPPRLTAVEGMITSSTVEKLMAVIKQINFTGPTYQPQTTQNALDFVAEQMQSAPIGILKSVLVMAPENETKNCGQLNMSQEITKMKNDLSSVFMWSSLDEKQCEEIPQEIVVQTGGICVKSRRGDSDVRKMVDAVVSKLSSKITKSVSCNCKTSSIGKVQPQCMIRQ